ncbi:hypothetical protein N802_18765 [Knoellia sinensis KCTC 19936]|uniref:Glycosyl transferase family 1 domain-containing protein n=1 Tax=Knoellia sinensis KCTC 19936 TaxID=1385520 RepID=A0A0A0J6K6_9MICO|nr:glycosyltransferase [Knoellia sinensis]KGN32409.1 hypothetical protein N802_18765 [Knoellia sinensis KCTC 19936]
MDVSLLSSGHDVSDARLHRIAAACIRAGLEVEVLGLGDPGGAPRGMSRVTSRPRPGMVGRALLAGRYAARAEGQVIVALDPDSLIASLLLGRPRGRKVVADVHEDYAALLADRAWATGVTGAVARGVVGVANSAAARADLTFVADEHVPPRTARRRVVVRNTPDRSMLPMQTEMTPSDEPRAVYVGDVRRSRGLFAMVGALAEASTWHLDLVGPVAAADREELDLVLREPGLRDRVTLHGQLPPDQSWAVARRAWVGLSLLADTPAFRDAMPSKVIEYLACGLPVLTTDLPRPAAAVRDAGAGAVVPAGADDEVALTAARVLRGWSEDPGSLAAARAAASATNGRAHAEPSPYDEAASAISDLARDRRTP